MGVALADRACVRTVLDLLGRIQDLEHPPRARARARQGGADLRELTERLEELSDVGEKNEQLPHREVRVQYLTSPYPGHAERARAEDHRDRAPVKDLEPLLRHLLPLRLLGVRRETLLLVILARIALDQWQGGDPLVDERVDLALRLLGGGAPHPHCPPEDLDRQQQDGYRDQRHRGEAQVQPGHRHPHEQERAGGADEGEEPLEEQGLKGARVRPGPEDDVPGLGAMVIAQREALKPAEDVIANPPQATEPHVDREVGVPATRGGVYEMKRQRGRDDGGELDGLPPRACRVGQPSRVRLCPEDAIDQERQGPGLQQVEPDAGEQQTQGQGYPPSVGPEVAQRPEQLTEAVQRRSEAVPQGRGIHTSNEARARHMPPSRDESGPPMSQILEVGMAVAAADMPAV